MLFVALGTLCVAAAAWGPARALSPFDLSGEGLVAAGPLGLCLLALGFFSVSAVFYWSAITAWMANDRQLETLLTRLGLAGALVMASILAASGWLQPPSWLPLLVGALLLGLAATGLLASATIAGVREDQPAEQRSAVAPLMPAAKARAARAVELALLSERLSGAGRREG